MFGRKIEIPDPPPPQIPPPVSEAEAERLKKLQSDRRVHDKAWKTIQKNRDEAATRMPTVKS